MYNLYATCPDEITDLLAKEIESIGGTNVRTAYRVVYFDATEEVFYKAHLQLRLASRINRILKSVPAQTPTIAFDKLKRIKFHEIFSSKMPLAINMVTSGQPSKVPAHLLGSKIREAVTDSFQHNVKEEANLSSRDAQITLNGFVDGNRLMLSIDTSMKSLHKRGYRLDGHQAPLKETLAAAMLKICGYDGSAPLFDPMCGSGTIIIEGAQIAMNKAPLIHRKKGEFGFEHLKDFNSELWRQVQDQTRAQQTPPTNKLYAADIDEKYVALARESALAARVEKYIEFNQADFFESPKPTETGFLVANIPYGIRLDEQPIDEPYLKMLGDRLKHEYKGWTCGILLPADAPLKAIGLKPEKRVSLLNGTIKVIFLVFTIY